MPDLANILVFPFFLIFARLGACIMIYPGFSDMAISFRVRLVTAMFITLALFPLLVNSIPTMPTSTAILVQYIFIEISIGLFFALSARFMFTSMIVAGELISFMTGLQAASLFDPRMGSNSTAVGVLLTIIGGVLIFATNLHHVMIEGLAESYIYFPPGEMLLFGDSLKALVTVANDLLVIGIKIAAPVMALGFLGYLGFGIFNRLIPQMHVFFVALPLAISFGLLMLGFALGGMLTLFNAQMHEYAILFTRG